MTIGASTDIKSYYRGFKSAWGALAGATALVPILSCILPSQYSYGFPPLGDATFPALAGLAILMAAITFLAYQFSHSMIRKCLIVILIVASIFPLYLYLSCYMRYVRVVDAPSISSAFRVSVGYERTEFARRTFTSGESDWDLLKQRGPYEEEVWRLWTAESIIRARLTLFGALCGFMLPLVFAFSLGVRGLLPDDHSRSAVQS